MLSPTEYLATQPDLQSAVESAVACALRERAPNAKQRVAECLNPAAAQELAELRREVARLRGENENLRGAAAGGEAYTAQRAAGELRGVGAMNLALWKMGAIRHEPPAFRYFDPKIVEQFPFHLKEVRLPFASETHEVCYEPISRCVFVSQMSNCVLVRIPIAANGMLLDDQDAWKIGPVDANGDGIAGLHNVSLSHANPGCLWISLQLANQVLLIEAATMRVRRILICPSLLRRADGTAAKVGGPHCLRECGTTGRIHVALKGSVPCHPGEEVLTNGDAKSLRVAAQRVCCNPQALKARMAELEELGYGSQSKLALEEAFAIWSVHPDAYDPATADHARGGTLYECRPSPPMIDIDLNCNLWVAQDRSETIMKVEPRSCTTTQLPVPHPPMRDCQMRITGPAIVTDPEGCVWCSLLGGNGALVRIEPSTNQRTLYLLPKPDWLRSMRLIHLQFVRSERGFHSIMPNVMGREMLCLHSNVTLGFAICSNLVDDSSINALIVLTFSYDCKQIIRMKEVPLPTQDCCCHRIAVLADGLPEDDWSVVVSQLASSQLTQVKLDKMEFGPMYTQQRYRDADGYEVRTYTMLETGTLTQSKRSKPVTFDKDIVQEGIDGSSIARAAAALNSRIVICDGTSTGGLPWCGIPGQGIWKGGGDLEKGEMWVDMKTQFVTEENMYDDETYPASAPRPDPVTGVVD